MQARNCAFVEIINGTTQFIIPVFQRDYRWTEDQCRQLWDDIMRTAQPDSKRGHFLGSIVYVAAGDTAAGFTRWLVVDGQQRLTTLTLLLTALRDHITEIGWSGGDDSPTPQQISGRYLKNEFESGSRQRKIVLRRSDDEVLQSLINCTTPDNRLSAIVEAYDVFRDLLKGTDPDVVYRGITNLVVVDVTLDRHIDNPQLVFESLNSTGIRLSQADLVRNYVLMQQPEADQTRLYEGYWSKIEALFRRSESVLDSFARDYVALRTKATKQAKTDQIYETFKRTFTQLTEEDGGIEQTLDAMTKAAGYYAAFSPGRAASGSLGEVLWHVRYLAETPALLITRLYQCYREVGSLSENEFADALALIESYVFRRAICRSQTRGYWSVFAGVAYQIDDAKPYQSLQVALARQRGNYSFPTDEEFRNALTENDLYGLRACWHLLVRLENAGSNEPTDTSRCSIEHIMPQNSDLKDAWVEMLGPDWRADHATWVHRLGNLTLTGYNSTLSDRPFDEKKTTDPGGFDRSPICLNLFVRQQSQWTAKEMQSRTEELATRALEIWKGLDVPQEMIDEADEREKRERARKSDVNQVEMTPDARYLFEALREEIKGFGDVIEIAERKSVSYHAPGFFVEVLPKKYELYLLLPLDYNEIDDPDEIAEDATKYKFIPNAVHDYDCGVVVYIRNKEQIASAMPIIWRAFTEARQNGH